MPTTTIPSIARQLDFRAPPGRVWRAITDETEIAVWFAQRARVELQVGALGYLEWDQHGRAPLRIEEIDPPRRFAWRWGDPGDTGLEGPSTLVEWELEPLPDGGTRLHFRESGFGLDRSRSENVEGWHDVLGELVEHVAEDPWQAGIRRSYRFRAAPERVWQAFANAEEFAAWWGSIGDLRLTPGAEGWFKWEIQGRHAVRIEAVEPERYFAWLWTIESGVPLDEAREVLRTEWLFWPAADGGTELRLLETGFIGPENHRENSLGWDTEVEPVLRKHLGEAV